MNSEEANQRAADISHAEDNFIHHLKATGVAIIPTGVAEVVYEATHSNYAAAPFYAGCVVVTACAIGAASARARLISIANRPH